MIKNKGIGFAIIVLSILLISVLTFVKINVDEQEAFLCEEVHKDPEIDIQECPAHESNNSWLLLLAFGVAALALTLGIIMLISNDKQNNTEVTEKPLAEIDISKLNEEEKKIYEIIKEKGGSAYQSDLIKETEFSKVKITRILDRMEQRKILDRHRRGMANLIVLK